VSDREIVATNGLDRQTRRLLGHLSLVGLFLEVRSPARERLEAELGDLAPVCLTPAVAKSADAQGSGPGRAA
jgi:hypothetical protein